MVRCWLLVHSPIVGPDTWQPVAERLSAAGDTVAVPRLEMGAAPPFAERHVAAAAAVDLPDGARPVVVAHSGAGPLVGAIAARLRAAGHPPAGHVLADAGPPATEGASRLDQLRAEAPDLADHLDHLLDRGERFPDWSDAQLAPLVPADHARRRLLAGLQPGPPGYWHEPLPTSVGRPDAPGGVLLFSASYEPTADWGHRFGWPVRRLADDNHFLPIAAPDTVAAALQRLARDGGF